MKQSKELKITVGYQPYYELEKGNAYHEGTRFDMGKELVIRGFTCTVEGEALAGKYSFYLIPEGRRLKVLPLSMPGTSPLEEVKKAFGIGEQIFFTYKEDFAPIFIAIQNHEMTEEEAAKIDSFLFRLPGLVPDKLAPEALEYFGQLLKRVLEGAGFVIRSEPEKRYYHTPAQIGFIIPAFGLGLQRSVSPEREITGYETSIVYLEHGKPESKNKVAIQLDLLRDLPEERMEAIEKAFKENLSPYGLKVLYLVLEGCAENKYTNSFALDSNRSLDLLGHDRDKRHIHYTTNKRRLLRTLDELTRINFKFETRVPASGQKGKEEIFRIEHPLINTTGKFEKYLVDEGQPAEKGKRIEDGVIIYFNPIIYKFIETRYTTIPHKFLQIDAVARGHAINLYAYIANQWRIGWSQYHGVIRQPMWQILEGAGLARGLKNKRRNQQRDFLEKIKDHLKWLKNNPGFWIKSVRFEGKSEPVLRQMVTIEMAEDHPLRIGMKAIEGP